MRPRPGLGVVEWSGPREEQMRQNTSDAEIPCAAPHGSHSVECKITVRAMFPLDAYGRSLERDHFTARRLGACLVPSDECQRLARVVPRAEHKVALLAMAATWARLARETMPQESRQ